MTTQLPDSMISLISGGLWTTATTSGIQKTGASQLRTRTSTIIPKMTHIAVATQRTLSKDGAHVQFQTFHNTSKVGAAAGASLGAFMPTSTMMSTPVILGATTATGHHGKIDMTTVVI